MTKQIEALKLALERLQARTDTADLDAIAAINEALVEQPAPAQEPVADRENAIIRFALHQFMSNAYSHMNAAAQDKDGRCYPLDAVEKFAKDAKDAEALLSRLQFKAPPAPAQPMTEEQRREIINRAWNEYLRGEGDDSFSWYLSQAIEAAHGITKGGE